MGVKDGADPARKDGGRPKDLKYRPSDRLLVRANVSDAALEAAFRAAGLPLVGRLKRVGGAGWRSARLRSAVSVERIIKALSMRGIILEVEPDANLVLASEPDDPLFKTEQWNLKKISAPEAWNLHTGNLTANVTICVIDGGFDALHPDLRPNLHPQYPMGYNALTKSYNRTHDRDHHGTLVAGIAAAAGNNSMGGAGVTWSTKLVGCRFDNTSTSFRLRDRLPTALALECMQFCRDEVGAQVVLTAFGSATYSQAMFEEISKGQAAGQLFVAAAGNNSTDSDEYPVYPASYPLDNIVSVCASDPDDNLARFNIGSSSYGARSVDLCAPGVNIMGPKPITAISTEGYTQRNGTSMASAMVAGSAALMMSYSGSTDIARIKRTMLVTVDRNANLTGRTVSGGRLNMLKALRAFSEEVVYSEGFEGSAAGAEFVAYHPTLVNLPTFWLPDVGAEYVRTGKYSAGIQMASPSLITNETMRTAVHFSTRPTLLESRYHYNMCLWAKYLGESSSIYVSEFQLMRVNDTTVVQTSPTTISSTWTEICMTVSQPPTASYYFKLGTAIFDGAYISIDDMSLTRFPA